jgi:bifunctional non-homologous end joining protein LigD
MEPIKTESGQTVSFTHTDKVFWPAEGYTKGDVIDYYNSIYSHIIKYLKDRPESLFRSPNGINEKGFFQKDAGIGTPEWIKTEVVHSDSSEKDIHYIVCDDKPTLLYMANLGCIEINPWNSRIQSPDHPDYLILDLDPSEHNTYDQVVETANVIKQILDKAGAASFPKTSGATGMHIYVPLGAKYTYEQAKDFAHAIASMTHEQLPGTTSLERNLAKRGKDVIYLDYLQNNKGQTLACAYSLRPKPGATVSTPLEWREVKAGLLPTDFTFKNILARVDKKGDLFGGVLLKGIDILKCLDRLSAK